MASIPSEVGVYEDAAGDLLIRFKTGEGEWVHVFDLFMTDFDVIKGCEFIEADSVAEHMPLKCISGRVE